MATHCPELCINSSMQLKYVFWCFHTYFRPMTWSFSISVIKRYLYWNRAIVYQMLQVAADSGMDMEPELYRGGETIVWIQPYILCAKAKSVACPCSEIFCLQLRNVESYTLTRINDTLRYCIYRSQPEMSLVWPETEVSCMAGDGDVSYDRRWLLTLIRADGIQPYLHFHIY
jgi:hypothetical protein